jgi:hypothetical protein
MLILLPKFPLLDSPNSAYCARIMPNQARLCCPIYERPAGKLPKCQRSFAGTQNCRLCRKQCRHIPPGLSSGRTSYVFEQKRKRAKALNSGRGSISFAFELNLSNSRAHS